MRASVCVSVALICLVPAIASSSPAYSESAACGGDKPVSEYTLQDTLSRRSIEILRVAGRGDASRLRTLVPASAVFTMGAHDVLWDIGIGPEGAIALSQQLEASEFQYTIMDGGPPPPATICAKHEVSLLLIRAPGKDAYQVSFQYKDGQLAHVWAHDILLFTGKIDQK